MSAGLPIFYACRTDVGRERTANEDSHRECELPDGSLLLVVADGMGGHASGEVASKIAIDAIGQIAQNSPSPDPREKLRNGFLVANQRILTEAERLGTGGKGMGTTAVATYVRGVEAYVAHVGDSRLYHVHDGAIAWHTTDHTRVQRMVQMGILSLEDAKHHPDANVVTRALGFAQLADGSALEPEVRESPIRLLAGDALVMCTDGLYDDVTNDEIAEALSGRTPEEATQSLVDLANDRGGHDNITITILYFGIQRGLPLKVVPRPDPKRRVTVVDGPKLPPDLKANSPQRSPHTMLLGGLAALVGLAMLVGFALVVLPGLRHHRGLPGADGGALLADSAPLVAVTAADGGDAGDGGARSSSKAAVAPPRDPTSTPKSSATPTKAIGGTKAVPVSKTAPPTKTVAPAKAATSQKASPPAAPGSVSTPGTGGATPAPATTVAPAPHKPQTSAAKPHALQNK